AAASDSASVAIVQDPQVTLVKTASLQESGTPNGTADPGETINYTIDVSNSGNMTLTGLVVTDPFVSNLAAVTSGGFNTGDIDQDGKLDRTETWHYTASHVVTATEVNTKASIDNTATVTTTQGASDSDTASVPTTPHPGVTLLKQAVGYIENNGTPGAGEGD